jgi:4-hydroxy-tetrahydrodipicolinate synthase
MPVDSELAGVIVPLLTPTDPEDRVDEPALRQSIDRLLAARVHGLFVGGSAGEGPLLTDPEWGRLLEITHDAVRGRCPVLAGVQDTSTARVVGRIGRAWAIGYRFYVFTPTYYVAVRTPAEHRRLFEVCREAAGGMEMIPYNLPQVVGASFAVETLCEGARKGWFRYCKESSGDDAYLHRLLSEGRAQGLKVLAGNERGAGTALLAGAVGLVPVCANIEPETYVRLWEAARDGNAPEVHRLQERIETLVEHLVLSGPCWLAGPKYALAQLGIGRGVPVSPLEPVGADQAQRIAALLPAGQPGPQT